LGRSATAKKKDYTMGGTCRMHGRYQNLKKGTLINPKVKEELCTASTRMEEIRYTKLSPFLLNTNDIGKVKYT
jgi:hypothetical protein